MSPSLSTIVRLPWSRTTAPAPSAAAPAWDLDALQRLLLSTFRREQIIAVSNREPYAHECIDGVTRVTQPASGLITAVEPVIRACGGTWIAHGGGNADRENVDSHDTLRVPPGQGDYRLRRVWLSDAEQRGHCDGFSNSGLWPLCHMVHVRPSFTESDWAHYRSVNQRFADAVVEEACCEDPVVLVHDYHLALVPAMVRRRLPRATIISFWHIPWAHAEQMGICPWITELLEGLLGSDIVGFQTPQHRRNFTESVERTLGLPATASPPDESRVTWRGRAVSVRAYPISIAWPEEASRPVDTVDTDRWNLLPDGKLVVGIDRFDYTKGLIERFRSVECLLETQPAWRARLRFVQVAAPTRTSLPDYGAFRDQVWAEVRRINARFAKGGWEPILLLDSHHDRQAVQALYRAADVCLVTSLHDGMNLVSKEFVAAREDERGVLVLSQFAGAAEELGDALIVNPYHIAQVAGALHRGLSMPASEQRRRMRALRATVREASVYRWAADMLLDAAALRTPGDQPAARLGRDGFGLNLATA